MTDQELALLKKVDDFQQIQNLQAKYGYLLQMGVEANWDEMVALFTDDATLEISDSGVYVGKAGIERFEQEIQKTPHLPGTIAEVMQLQPYIQVYGDTASAVWQGFGFLGFPRDPEKMLSLQPREGKMQLWLHGRYENEYRKVNGKWKISKLHFKVCFRTPFEDGWVKTPIQMSMRRPFVIPDRPPTEYRPFNPDATTPEEAMSSPILPPEA